MLSQQDKCAIIEDKLSMPKLWNRETKPHKFCPGCGHGLVLKMLAEAIEELKIEDNTIFGCDIGCSLLAWDFFNLDTVQTHHGRTTPVMVGISRSRDDLISVAYMGDGAGYSIGTQHLINAAIRNERVFVLVVNNTIYAMTGGQMSPATLSGQKTATSPFGRDPKTTGITTKGAEMIAAVADDKAYVARASVARLQELRKFLKKALKNQMENKSFSFVEVLSTCPTNWRTGAEKTWDFLDKDMSSYFKVKEFSQ